jgi:hypothetical protein
MQDVRRASPRIDVQAMCWEIVANREASAMVVDLSTTGARLERPFLGGRIDREVPLQIEVPGIDEVMWARGDLVFDSLSPGPGPFGLIRRTGFRIAIAAQRDLRMLRDYIHEVNRAKEQVEQLVSHELAFASCYLRG